MRTPPTPKPARRVVTALALLRRSARTASERRAIDWAIAQAEQRAQRKQSTP